MCRHFCFPCSLKNWVSWLIILLITDLLVPNSGWLSLFSWVLQKVLPFGKSWYWFNQCLVNIYWLLYAEHGTDECEEKQNSVSPPRGSYYPVLSVVPRPAKSASSGAWLERQIFRPHPRPTKSENLGGDPQPSVFGKNPLQTKIILIKCQNNHVASLLNWIWSSIRLLRKRGLEAKDSMRSWWRD